jgi:DNA (cytosine-5)-methyltransferase 1
MKAADLLKEAGVAKGELDILDGSPPCQGFSMAGKRILDDPRNSLFLDFCRLLKGVQPKCFIMENVAGLLVGKMRPIFRAVTVELERQGYVVAVRHLNAAYLGVPQQRNRLIWIGARKDTGMTPVHPVPMYSPVPAYEVVERTGDFLAGSGRLGRPARLEKISGPITSVTPRVANTPEEANRSYFTSKMPLERRAAFNRPWQRMSSPAPTVTAFKPELVTDLEIGAAAMSHETYKNSQASGQARALTLAECAALQSFPAWYEFVGSKSDQMKQIGNAVPPLMAAHIVMAVIAGMFGRELPPDLPGPTCYAGVAA